MPKLRQRFAQWRARTKQNAAHAAERDILKSLFDDYYTNRRYIYRLNFFRGIFFGLGSVLGGTIVVALSIWILSWFVDFPLVGQWIQQLIDVLPQSK